MTSPGARLAQQLPVWARRSHPALRYELGEPAGRSVRARLLRALGVALAGLVLLTIGMLIPTTLDGAMGVLYFPSLIVQFILMAAAFSLTLGKVAREQQRRNWDNLRATPDGAELTLRARWAAVYYRLRGLLGAVLAVRVVLLLALLWDLTAFQGRHLDLLISGITPTVAMPVAVALLALTMTAGLLLPITSVGMSAALGLVAGTLVRGRTYQALTQVVFIVLRVAVALALLFAVSILPDNPMPISGTAAWLLFLAAAAFGDWGLLLLSLSAYADLWAQVPFGIFLGPALLGWALIQAALSDALLRWAARRAQRTG